MAALALIPVLTLLDALLHPRWAAWGIGAAAGCFVAIQAGQVHPGIRRSSLVLALITLALLPLVAAPWQALERGMRIGGLIASLLITVNLLSRAVGRVGRAREVLAGLLRVPAGSRYLSLSIASQFFGGLLGLAGIAMMMEAAAGQKDLGERERIAAFSAIARGYAALSLWSPMYSNMSIVLGLYPGARWTAVLPVALSITALFIVLGVALDRLYQAPDEPHEDAAPRPSAGPLLRQAAPVILGMLAFLTLVVLASQGLGWPISAVIIVGAPLSAWLVNALLLRGQVPHPLVRGAGQTFADMASFRVMAGEVLMFLASGCAGTVIAAALPGTWTAALGQAVAGSPALACLALSTAIVLLSSAAIHPMLSAIIVGSGISPALLGLPTLVHLSAILVGWGLAIIVTPFSVLSLMASRWSGIPVLAISLRANAMFVLLALAVSAALLGVVAGLIHP